MSGLDFAQVCLRKSRNNRDIGRIKLVRTWLLPRAPRFYWLIILVFAASTITSDLPGFGEGHWSISTAFRACVVAIAVVLAALSEIWDIAPAVIVNAEARYQNRQAREVYTIPVVFDVAPTPVPGISRLRVTRTDDNLAIRPWVLRFEHAVDGRKGEW
ncbi:hypothetical protein [Brucella tritici]|uniref:Uncharacterized protein n=1 Tax=Brucella tritici TaxID=94626 RepID=A0A6L3YCH6_9HYPH|nr:hypothetical protein [Brucella tritici]KAB2676689.1 hypothetical protein F9L08_26265 [Brucella tritici]